MTNEEFISKVGNIVVRLATDYNVKVASPIIAQACLESAYGTSDKVLNNRNNLFGIKYRKGRVDCNSGYFNATGSEQNVDGSYRPISTDWYSFDSYESCIRGYFEFISISRYANLHGVLTPEEYCRLLKADEYATSLLYDYNLIMLLNQAKYNMKAFDVLLSDRYLNISNGSVVDSSILNDSANSVISDNSSEVKEESNAMSNSPLVTYTKISSHKTSPRESKISKITIHHMAGNLSVETCGNVFQGTRECSSNYGVSTDGKVGLYVDEKDRSWASSSSVNDNMAVTIEVADDGGADTNWHVSDVALAKTIELCADICSRNGIKSLNWTGDTSGNLTVHRMFKATTCPGEYLLSKMSYIASEVNKQLGVSTANKVSEVHTSSEHSTASTSSDSALAASIASTVTEIKMYRVRKSWDDADSQIGAFTILANAKKACKSGYFVYDNSGSVVYTPISTASDSSVVTKQQLVKDIIAGKYGNGSIRRNNIRKLGYDVDDIQSLVNKALS